MPYSNLRVNNRQTNIKPKMILLHNVKQTVNFTIWKTLQLVTNQIFSLREVKLIEQANEQFRELIYFKVTQSKYKMTPKYNIRKM